jgi:hypothetical protein
MAYSASDESPADKTEGTFKHGIKKSAKEVKQGFVEYGRTMKKEGKKLKKHVKKSYQSDKEKIKQDWNKLKPGNAKESEK